MFFFPSYPSTCLVDSYTKLHSDYNQLSDFAWLQQNRFSHTLADIGESWITVAMVVVANIKPTKLNKVEPNNTYSGRLKYSKLPRTPVHKE